jgi:hypothetical protein
MNISTVRKENHKEDLVIKEHLVTQSPTSTPYWTRKLRQDETCILGMNTQNIEREGNSKSLLHAKQERIEPNYPSQVKATYTDTQSSSTSPSYNKNGTTENGRTLWCSEEATKVTSSRMWTSRR